MKVFEYCTAFFYYHVAKTCLFIRVFLEMFLNVYCKKDMIQNCLFMQATNTKYILKVTYTVSDSLDVFNWKLAHLIEMTTALLQIGRASCRERV